MTESTLTQLPSRDNTLAISDAAPWWVLRVGAALCFIGHGAFGLITKAAWVPYFGVVGIPEPWAWKLMPVVGAIDIAAGIVVLLTPRALPVLYMAVWALWTALLRPLAGESVFETIERAGNYGVPAAFLLWYGAPRSWRALLQPIQRGGWAINPRQIRVILQWTTCLLLAGHGALGALTGKPMLTQHYAALGLPVVTTQVVGWFELALAAAIAIRPAVGLLLVAAGWKLATESLFLAAGAPIWEVIERAGSYAAPLALAGMIWRAGRVSVARPSEVSA